MGPEDREPGLRLRVPGRGKEPLKPVNGRCNSMTTGGRTDDCCVGWNHLQTGSPACRDLGRTTREMAERKKRDEL